MAGPFSARMTDDLHAAIKPAMPACSHALFSAQVLTPAVTLAICAAFGLERLTVTLLVSIFMITAGTGAATAVEVGVAGFAWMGFFSFLLSVLLEAARVVYIQLLLGRLNYNAMEVREDSILSYICCSMHPADTPLAGYDKS